MTTIRAKAHAGRLASRTKRLLGELGRCPVGSMAYATATFARFATGDGRCADAVRWLRRRQHCDGCWGGAVPNAQDRLVSTLAAVLALRDIPEDWAVDAVRAGVDYLTRHGADWRQDLHEMIGFEVVAADLVDHANTVGLLLDHHFGELRTLRTDKLSRIPAGVLTGQPTSLLYSLEALLPLIAPSDMDGFFSPDGSMSNNPAATAAAWSATGRSTALDYLRRAADSTGDGGMPEIFPIDVFEPAWVLYTLNRAGLLDDNAVPHVTRLAQMAARSSHHARGMGVTEHFPVPDSDDTAMVANVLHAAGRDDSELLAALLTFETDTHFLGFSYERGAAISANARVLEALARRPDRYRPQIAKATSFLLDTRRDSAWWFDKWHMSSYYATAQAVLGLASTAPHELAQTRQWLLDGQHSNGAWGVADGLAEETAYAILALDAIDPHLGPMPADTCRRAHDYLRDHLDGDDYPELWIGKGLYTPTTVVRAAVLAAYAISGRQSGLLADGRPRPAVATASGYARSAGGCE